MLEYTIVTSNKYSVYLKKNINKRDIFNLEHVKLHRSNKNQKV